jgi:prepilin-type N-terminal cleavage/methylation domain-containing protein
MRRTDAGFTLVETLIAMVITAVGVLGVATLFVVGTKGQVTARDSSRAVLLATAELERIRMLPVSAPERANGGSLTTDVAAHFAVRGQTTVRWTVADGPACGPVTWAGPGGPVECTKDIAVVAVPTNNQARTIRIDARLWR